MARPTTAGTLSAWAKLDSAGDTASGRVIKLGVSQGTFKGFHITQSSTNSWQITVGDGTSRQDVTTGNTFDVWEHIVGTFDGTNVKIYVNGVLKSEKSFASETSIVYVNTSNLIGRFNNNDGEFEGDIDDVRIYNVALGPEEVAKLYNNGAGTEDNNISSLRIILKEAS